MHLTLLYLKLVAGSALGALLGIALVNEVVVVPRLALRTAAYLQLKSRLVKAARQARSPADIFVTAVVGAVRQPLAGAARPLEHPAGEHKVVIFQHHLVRVRAHTHAVLLFFQLVERTRRAALLRQAATLRAAPEPRGTTRPQRLLARGTVPATGADCQSYQLVAEVCFFQLSVRYESL